MASYQQRPPVPVETAAAMDDEYDYSQQEVPTPTPTSASARGVEENQAYSGPVPAPPPVPPAAETPEEALLDLAQLEELQVEAEKMKALGNKHMAAQEYARAYNAYSAALQLSPVGPSSHVFLSNRAAALLSLKRYQAAATDAKRAIALAPTFGKAHARLGQALYFLKDYPNAIKAYQDASSFEPDNPVTQAYLEKAKNKYEKQLKKSRGEEASTTGDNSTIFTMQNSITTSDNQNVVQSGYRGITNPALLKAAAKSPSNQRKPIGGAPDDDDPDFDEALRIQQRANAYLSRKNYKAAVEEYTAALFLVPDDPNLSPELHLGRAHALNGSRRHDSARNDAQLAIRLHPHPAAYSTLAKSLFYMKNYRGAIDAFDKCESLLPEGDSLGMFDKAYLQKAQSALEEEQYSLKEAGTPSKSPSAPIPKLRPPRFVPREEAMQSPSSVPAMPKQWPQQSQAKGATLRCGPERNILFLSESLGVKLNRGSDGVVRVISVTPNTPASPVARKGTIEAGDIVREAAGVDIRRPITNLMWGDTVALIKMAPRPIAFVVAKELSAVPLSVREEIRVATTPTASSPSSGDGPVSSELERTSEEQVLVDSISNEFAQSLDLPNPEDIVDDTPSAVEDSVMAESTIPDLDSEGRSPPGQAQSDGDHAADQAVLRSGHAEDPTEVTVPDEPDTGGTLGVVLPSIGVEAANEKRTDADDLENPPPTSELSFRDKEEQIIGGEILFRSSSCGWDNLRWMSYAGVRKVRLCQTIYRCNEAAENIGLFWMSTSQRYVYERRRLAIYEEPQLILVLKCVGDTEELRRLLGLPDVVDLDASTMNKYWVVESIVDPVVSRLRLSRLTTPSSSGEGTGRELSCFELLTPGESIKLSAVQVREGVRKEEQSFSDSGAFLETTAVETALKNALCSASPGAGDIGNRDADISWMHQLILGTLHSVVISGNQKLLEEAIEQIQASLRGSDCIPDNTRIHERFIDAVDENGHTPLYYACLSRMSEAVATLINAGASVGHRSSQGMELSHICALNLDDKSLSMILSSTFPSRPDPNALDDMGRTPFYLAAVKGRLRNESGNAMALSLCIKALEAWGGQMFVEEEAPFASPVKISAAEWRAAVSEVLLSHLHFRFPLQNPFEHDDSPIMSSLGAFYEYPLHAALISLKWRLKTMSPAEMTMSSYSGLVQTLTVFLEHGFEPNERLEFSEESLASSQELASFVGYTPLQILASAALELETVEAELSDDVYLGLTALISDSGEVLVKFGARIALDAPPHKRPRGKGSERNQSSHEPVSDDHRAELKVEVNKKAIELLGGTERLRRAAKEFGWLPAAASTDHILPILKIADSIVPEDSDMPGASHEKSCAICWCSFGSLVNRKHRCRVTCRYVCDQCSTKRVVFDGKEYRVSDGQYNIARLDAIHVASHREAELLEQERVASLNRPRSQSSDSNNGKPTPTSRRTLAQIRLDRLAAAEEADRTSLFGGMLDSAAKMLGSNEQEDAAARQVNQVEGLAASMSQTRNALLERGEKLNTLNDKSAQMVDQSAEFARLAKELRKKSESTNWFGF